MNELAIRELETGELFDELARRCRSVILLGTHPAGADAGLIVRWHGDPVEVLGLLNYASYVVVSESVKESTQEGEGE
jgi:hypothetical protein